MAKLMNPQSCCCFTLKTGGMIVGWFGLVTSVLLLCFSIPMYQEHLREHSELFDESVSVQMNGLSIGRTEIFAASEVFAFWRKVSLIFLIGESVISALLHGLFLYGVIKSEHLCIIPWLVMNVLNLIFYGFIMLGGIVLAIQVDPSLIGLTIGAIPSFLIIGYIWLCMFSLYKNIREENNVKELQIKYSTHNEKSPSPYKHLEEQIGA